MVPSRRDEDDLAFLLDNLDAELFCLRTTHIEHEGMTVSQLRFGTRREEPPYLPPHHVRTPRVAAVHIAVEGRERAAWSQVDKAEVSKGGRHLSS